MRRGTQMIEAISKWSLRKLFLALLKDGEHADLFARLHQFLSRDSSVFLAELQKVVQTHPWQQAQILLEKLTQSTIGSWIPESLWPHFYILDLEYCPYRQIISEIAILECRGLQTEASPQSKIRPGGLSQAEIQELIDGSLGQVSEGFLVGHNLRGFDLVRLEEANVRVPDLPILDTLELSLLTYPLKFNHSLDGTHRALDDVRANLHLLRSLDQFWSQAPDGFTLALAMRLQDPGLKTYFQWQATRRGLRDAVMPSPRPAEGPAKLGPSPAIQSNRVLPAPSGGDDLGSAILAQTGVLVDRQTLCHLRYRVQEKSSCLLEKRICLHSDQGIRPEALRETYGRPKWSWVDAFLLSWWAAGGQYAHEIHPFVRTEVAAAIENFVPVTPDRFDIWEHRLLWEGGPLPVRLVVYPELLYDAEVGKLDVRITDEHHKELIRSLFRHRELEVRRQAIGPSRVLFDATDRQDPDWTALMAGLQSSPEPSMRAVGQKLAELDKVILRYDESSEHELRLQAWPVGQQSKIPTSLQRPEAWTASGPDSPFLQRYLKETGAELDPAVANPSRQGAPLRVAANAGLGSPSGVRRDLVSLLPWLLAAPQSTGLLGFGEEPRRALAFALNSAGIEAHHQGRYGSRRRTVLRTADRPALFLGDTRPAPLPSFTREVISSRLPFPSRDDPTIILSMQGREQVDVFAEIVLPVMLERLRRHRLVLAHDERESILFDRRALDFGFRDQIEAVLGPVQEVRQPPEPAQNSAIVEKLRIALPEKELAGDADPMVVLRRLQGPLARWRLYQEQIVTRILKGENVLAVLPTGSGKSACFQVPALLYGEVLESLTIVISPLRALMRDQVRGLRAKGMFGIDYYNGELSSEEKERVLRDVRFGWTVMLYLAPEQLLNPTVLDVLLERGVRLIVVDEAHCLSEWGHDFRPEYLKIPALADRLAAARGEKRPQIAAFTATATKPVQEELVRILSLHPTPVVASVERPNLHPVIELVEEESSQARLDKLESFIRQRRGQYGLIYAFRRRDTEMVCQELRQRLADVLPLNAIDFLHAGASNRGHKEMEYLDPDRPTRILVATTAFGMGIDKPDIGWIAHYNAPQTVEDYTQQIGRAARDSKLSASILTLVHPRDLLSAKDPLDEAELCMLLDVLRQKEPSHGKVNVDVEGLARLTGLKEEEAKAALFLLERAGILVVEQWSAQLQSTRKTGRATEELGTDEQLLLSLSPDEGVPDLKQLTASFPLTSETEWVRRQRQLIRKGALLSLHQVSLRAVGKGATRQLQDWQQREMKLAQWLHTEFAKQMGRPLRLSLTRLLDVLGPGVGLGHLERILTSWRVSRLIFQEQGLTDVRLSRNRHSDLLETLAAEGLERSELINRLETLFPQPMLLAKGSAEWDRARRVAAGLEARGVAVLEESPGPGNSFRVKLLGRAEDDHAKLSELDFMPRRRSGRERALAVSELFSTARSGVQVWEFLKDYFEREESPELRQLREKLLVGLTAQQAEAVMATGRRPLLINAGAGSGKTHVLSRRLMMLQGLEMIDAKKLLVLSFSRAGAAAIGARARSVGASAGLAPIRCLTFHSFARQILHLFSYKKALVGRRTLPKELRRENDWRKDHAFNRVMVDHYDTILAQCQQLKTPSETIDAYLGTFDALRGGHPQLEEVVTSATDFNKLALPARLRLPDDRGDLASADVGKAFSRYLAILEQTEQTDFAGMVTDCLLLLKTDEVVRRRLQRGIRHLLVDEFQDTSRAQEAVMRLLVGHHGGLTVVGDSDQTIYTFNGSDVRNILHFAARNRELWPDRETQLTNLEENFRSTSRIIDTATRFIERNTQRVPKRLRASASVSDEMRQAYRNLNLPVWLRQTPSLADAVGCAFYTVRGWLDEGLYPKEIAVLSRLNPAANKDKQVLDQLREAFGRAGIPVAGESLDTKRVAEAVSRLARENPEFPLAGLTQDHPSLYLVPESFRPVVLEEARSLGLQTVGEWAETLGQERSSPVADRVQDSEGVQLLTIHQSKGREYRRVIVLHLADKFFPPAQSMPKDFEEERRVLYVAMTRAEEQLMVTGQPDSALFRELVAAAENQAEIETWEAQLPSPPAPSWEDFEETELITAPESALPEDEVEPFSTEAVEVRIGETNLLSQFQEWKDDHDEDD